MADLLEVIGDSQKRHLLQLLASGEKTVTQLANSFPVTRSAISQHLLALVQVGLVSARKEGRNRFYRLESKGMASLQSQFDAFWNFELDLLLSQSHAMNSSTTPDATDQTTHDEYPT